MRSIKKGAASQSVYFEFLDSTSTTGGRKTGLVYNTSSLTAYYVRNQGSATAITLATLAAANSAWSSGGFKEVDATNMPGVYRLDVPDAAFATGVDDVTITMKGATGMAQASMTLQLVDNTSKDTYDRIGAPIGASISADIQVIDDFVDTEVAAIKTKTDQLVFTVANQVDVNVIDWKSATAPAMTGDAFARLGAPAGASVSADVAAVKAVLPAALVSGRIDASVGTMAANVITAAAMASDAGAEIADAVWDEAISGHLTAGSTGNALNAAGSAGDPWSTPLPGSYGAGTAGKIVGDNIDAAISSRLASASYTAPDNSTITAINAKTTNLPSDPADASDIAASFVTVNSKLDAIDDFVDTEVSAIKAKTDSLTFTVAGQVDANIQYVNDVLVTGDGQTGTEWGPV